MADDNEIRDYAEERGTYNFLSRFLGGGNGMNRMFWTAFVLVAAICLFVWGLHKIVNNGSSITWDKVKSGDKLYARPFFTDTILKSLTIYKLARPINASDIDTMKIEEWQKAKLKTHLDTSLKPQLIASELRFEADSIFKSKTSYMGIFISKDSILQNVFTDKWYVFKPEFERPSFWKISLSKGYVLANKDYYMDASDARLEEAPQFKK